MVVNLIANVLSNTFFLVNKPFKIFQPIRIQKLRLTSNSTFKSLRNSKSRNLIKTR